MKQTRIQKHYSNIVAEDIILMYNCQTVMQLPKLNRGVLSISSRSSLLDKQELIKNLASCLLISGQRGAPTRAQKSISAFQLRKGSVMGCMVTMRRNRMYALLDKIVTFVLPCLQDQPSKRARLGLANEQGTNTLFAFKGGGVARVQSPSGWFCEKEERDVSFGIKEATVFPEIESLFALRKEQIQNQVLHAQPTQSFALHGMYTLPALQDLHQATKTVAQKTMCKVLFYNKNRAFLAQPSCRYFAMPAYKPTLNSLQGLNVLFSFCTHRSHSKRKRIVPKCMPEMQNLDNKLSFPLQKHTGKEQLGFIRNKNRAEHMLFPKKQNRVSNIATEKQKDLLFLSAFQHPVRC